MKIFPNIAWNKNYKEILWVLASLITLTLWKSEIILHSDLTAYEKIYLALIAYTGLVVTWYTKETFDLKEHSRKTLLSSIQPILVPLKSSSPYLYLKNSGRGIAKDIRWKTISGSVKIISDESLQSGIIEPLHGGVNIKDLVCKQLISYQLTYQGTGTIEIKYSDERNNIYYSKIEITGEHFRLLRTGSVRELKH